MARKLKDKLKNKVLTAVKNLSAARRSLIVVGVILAVAFYVRGEVLVPLVWTVVVCLCLLSEFWNKLRKTSRES